jgi:hypothetical protein
MASSMSPMSFGALLGWLMVKWYERRSECNGQETVYRRCVVAAGER